MRQKTKCIPKHKLRHFSYSCISVDLYTLCTYNNRIESNNIPNKKINFIPLRSKQLSNSLFNSLLSYLLMLVHFTYDRLSTWFVNRLNDDMNLSIYDISM